MSVRWDRKEGSQRPTLTRASRGRGQGPSPRHRQQLAAESAAGSPARGSRAALCSTFPAAFPGSALRWEVLSEGLCRENPRPTLSPLHEEGGARGPEGSAGQPGTPRLTHRQDGPLLRPLVAVLGENVAVGGRGGGGVIFLILGGGGMRRVRKTGKKWGHPRESLLALSSLPRRHLSRELSTLPGCPIRGSEARRERLHHAA